MQASPPIPTLHPSLYWWAGEVLDCHVHQSHFIDMLDSQNLLLRGLKFGVGENPGFM